MKNRFFLPLSFRFGSNIRTTKGKRGMLKYRSMISSAMVGTVIFAATHAANAQAVPLGAAQNFAIVSYAGVTNSGLTTITGDIGLSPLTSITGFSFSSTPGPGVLSGTVHYNDALAIQAQADSLTAFNTIAGMAYLPANDLTGTDLGGKTLTPGVYHFETSAGLTGNLTLATLADPNAVFIFQIGSTLTTAVGSSVTVTGAGAGLTPNIFWQVGSSATLNTGTAFSGSILSMASVSMGTGSSIVNGRMIALNGATTLLSNSVSRPTLLLLAPGRYWNGRDGNLWSSTTAWSSTAAGVDHIPLGANVDVIFSVTTAPVNQNTVLDVDTIISSLTVNDAAAVTIGGTRTLTLSSTGLVTGINVNNGAGYTTIGSNLELGNLSQVIKVNNSAGMLITGTISGTNGLTKAGTGVLTLVGTETYTGATVVSGGTLQLGDGIVANTSIAASNSVLVTAGSTLGINLKSGESFGNSVNDNGRIHWNSTNPLATNTQSAAAVFRGTGSMLITATGETVLYGNNTFSGGSTINTPGEVRVGSLTANTSSAFGTGVLTINNGYVDTVASQVLRIDVGGYVQTGGQIGMHLQGTTLGTYTQFNDSGSSTLSGGTVFAYDLSGVYVPYGAWRGNTVGDQQNIIRTTTGLTGEFASNLPYSNFYNAAFDQNFLYHKGDTLLYPTVTYDPENAYITWVQDPFVSAPGLSSNGLIIGAGLDGYQDQNPVDPGGLLTYLDGQNVSTLAAIYDAISPSDLTAIFQMGFSAAEIQNASIGRHLEQTRQQTDTYDPPVTQSSSKDAKGVIVQRTSSPVMQEGNRWNIYVEGSGGSATVDGSDGINGYDFDTFGTSLGADYRVNNHLTVGILGNYANSEASLANGGNIEADGYRAAVYATVYQDGFYMDALLGGGYNSYDTKRSAFLGYAEASPEGSEVNALLNGGYDMHQGNWTFGVMTSVAYTEVFLDEFRETGSFAPLAYDDQSQQSLRSNLGARIAYTIPVGGITVTPQVRASWQHEFLDSTQAIRSQFSTGSSPFFTVNGPEIGKDSALLSAGVNVQFSPVLSVYAYYDGQLGRTNYSSNNFTVGLKYEF